MPRELAPDIQAAVCKATGAESIEVVECIQELWSGYGQIVRIRLHGVTAGSASTVIAKHVCPPKRANHPRGWNSSISHQRKLRSYEVEPVWYRDWSVRCDEACRVASHLTTAQQENGLLLLLEDLDAAGYPVRLNALNDEQLAACLNWLAHFHATFMGVTPNGLWQIGTYWHLATRPEELQALGDQPLKEAAAKIDTRLNKARHQTLVHGDAKLANFCFSATKQGVAAVDFQYVGGGCGMKDVAYFLGSCLNEEDCEARESELLDQYFTALRHALAVKQPQVDADALEAEWRELFPIAWTDFHRFLKGWSPGHWKINSYSERLAREVIATI